MTQPAENNLPTIFVEVVEHDLAALTQQVTNFSEGWQGIYLSVPGMNYQAWQKKNAQLVLKSFFERSFQNVQKASVFFFCDQTVLVMLRMPSQIQLDSFTKRLAALLSPNKDEGEQVAFKSVPFDFSQEADREKFSQFSKSQIEKNRKLRAEMVQQEGQFDFSLSLTEADFLRRQRREETRALIIEDDEITAMLLRGVIDKECHVVMAENASTAKDVYESTLPDLVFLDIGLPDADGLALLEKIREADKDVHVVMLTANGYLENVQKSLSLGAKGFIVKPFTAEKVKAYVKAARA